VFGQKNNVQTEKKLLQAFIEKSKKKARIAREHKKNINKRKFEVNPAFKRITRSQSAEMVIN